MKRITIIGGGLAGLTLGLALRRQEVPVTVMEAGHYPRHRVCGEFVSGQGAELLDALCVKDVRHAESVALFDATRCAGSHLLPKPARCISRFVLDATLASRFRAAGGELCEGDRWRGVAGEGLVFASGRRPCAVANGHRWFGLKVHARAVKLAADLEMHIGQDCYVGLCRLPDDTVNVCGLFRRKITEGAQGDTMDWLRGEPGSPLSARLKHADFDERSFCAVAGLSLRRQAIEARECRIGDALTMIPPITGNGMSMALESAQLALQPLVAYARGEKRWANVTEEIASTLDRRFTRRLSWAALLHQMIFSRSSRFILPWLFRVPGIWRTAFAVTR